MLVLLVILLTFLLLNDLNIIINNNKNMVDQDPLNFKIT